jgi:hypothetical protein
MVKKYYVGSLLVQRYGHLTIPSWFYGSAVSSPSADQSLVTVSIPANALGYIYGFFISASEGNDFEIRWTDTSNNLRSYRVVLAGRGTVHYADIVALNEGIPARGETDISINVINAGSSDSYYQAGLLVGVVYG